MLGWVVVAGSCRQGDGRRGLWVGSQRTGGLHGCMGQGDEARQVWAVRS